MSDRANILVVEDSIDDFELLVATLRAQAMTMNCRRVDTADQMRAALLEQPWQLVISDHHMPSFSSTEALRLLRQFEPHLPFIIVSGTIGEDAAVAAMHAGADDYLIKGRLARLGAAIERALASADQRRRRVRAETALIESVQRLRALSAHLQDQVENERRSIARDIHDAIGGELTALRFDLGWIRRNGEPSSGDRAQRATEVLDRVVEATQRIVQQLRPPVLDAGIVAALQWLVGDFRRRSSIECRFTTNRDSIQLPDRLAATVFRTAQESLTNVLKHAEANSVEIDLVALTDQLSLEIRDDGIGIDGGALSKPTSFGLRGLIERVQDSGGTLDILPGDSGTTVLLSLPFRLAT